ncbi:AMP-binding protein [Plantactinospora sonchi]|uniref:AMP-binding protein n=1 Tax=Plantactinospora sonchi TaxID=1544735 RepID=A0ABU7RSC7_9ACTN
MQDGAPTPAESSATTPSGAGPSTAEPPGVVSSDAELSGPTSHAVTLADRVRLAAATRGDQPALVWPEGTLHWAELDRAVDRVADALRRRLPGTGDPHPDRVAIALGNTPEFAIAFFAVQRAGLVAVPVNPTLTGPELRHILADSGAALLIGTEPVRATVAELVADLPTLSEVYTALPGYPGEPADGDRGAPAAEAAPGGAPSADGEPGGAPVVADPEALAVLLYTSGTTGHPKGAMLSHRALLANHRQIDRISPAVVGPADRVLLALPMFHAYGLNAGLGAVAYHGACGVLVDRFDAADVLEVVERHRVSVLVGVPSMFVAWLALPATGGPSAPDGPSLDTAMASVRVAVCGAAPLGVADATRFAERTGHRIGVGYGLTETAPVLTSTLVGPAGKTGSIGRPLPGVELRLVAPDGEVLWQDGTTVQSITNEDESDDPDLELPSPGTDPGEIVVRGANLFSGYWPDGHDGPDADGWWRTGDIAYADADADLFLVDRLGELILVHGFNVYPQEVERVLNAHPAVAGSLVLGAPDPLAGETVVAYVVPRQRGEVTAAELAAHCAGSLARFKRPGRIEFVGSLPYSAIGRVRRSTFREAAGSGDG